ncbi:PHD finger protein 7-like [Anas acuta]|uniref:PHD finger protein 7-like n=1 Tax=Anas acuta TaxID=28680 RepID=UPI0035C8E672
MAAALPPPECVLCHRSDTSLDGCGLMLKVDGVCAHVHCLYPAQGLYQRGAEGEGISRFLCADIRRVAARAARKRCCVCRKKGATVACRQKRCSRRFHLPCSSQRGCISQFFGEYSSFCWEHRPQQTVETLQEGHTTCIICMEVVEDSLSYTTMVCPSCKHAWFHRACIQGQAYRAGLGQFACPHCRDQERFVPEMLQMGIRVPNMSAAPRLLGAVSHISSKPCSGCWGSAQAPSPLLGRHEQWFWSPGGLCGATACWGLRAHQHNFFPRPWQLLLCSSCAASGTHRRCSGLADTTQQWECAGCAGPGTAGPTADAPALGTPPSSGSALAALAQALLLLLGASPTETVEMLQEGHTTCIICMEVVEDSLSYTTMVCPSCKHAWFHRACIQQSKSEVTTHITVFK